MILNDPSNYNFITTCFFAQMTAAYLDNSPLKDRSSKRQRRYYSMLYNYECYVPINVASSRGWLTMRKSVFNFLTMLFILYLPAKTIASQKNPPMGFLFFNPNKENDINNKAFWKPASYTKNAPLKNGI